MSNKNFTRKELERLNVGEQDIELILKCQKQLPILFENNSIAKYSVNAIDLWNQIGSKNHFYDWSKNNIIESDNVAIHHFSAKYQLGYLINILNLLIIL